MPHKYRRKLVVIVHSSIWVKSSISKWTIASMKNIAWYQLWRYSNLCKDLWSNSVLKAAMYPYSKELMKRSGVTISFQSWKLVEVVFIVRIFLYFVSYFSSGGDGGLMPWDILLKLLFLSSYSFNSIIGPNTASGSELILKSSLISSSSFTGAITLAPNSILISSKLFYSTSS